MIARMWHGQVPQEHAEAFYQHLLDTGVAELGRKCVGPGFSLAVASASVVPGCKRILIVDDDAAIGDMLQLMLEDCPKSSYEPV